MASANAKISLAHFRVLHIVPSNHWSSERHFSRHPDSGGDADHTIVDWYNCNYQRHLYADIQGVRLLPSRGFKKPLGQFISNLLA